MPALPGGSWRTFDIGEARVIPAKRIQCAVGTDDMRAAAIDPVLIPSPRIHEWFYEKPEGVGFVHFELLEQPAQWFGLAAALDEVLESITNFVTQEILDSGEINKIADGIGSAIGLEEVADRRAVRVSAGKRSEILESQPAGGLRNGGQDNVRCGQRVGRRPATRTGRASSVWIRPEWRLDKA